MVDFRVMIIEYYPGGGSRGDMDTMIKKAKTLKKYLLNSRFGINESQIDVEKNYKNEYCLVEICSIPDSNIKKVLKICKKIEPYSIRTNWNINKQ